MLVLVKPIVRDARRDARRRREPLPLDEMSTRRSATRDVATNVKVDGGRTRARSHRIGPCAFDNLRGNMLLRW